MITPGIYEHFKGGWYEVIGVAEHTESAEKLVVYHAIVGDTVLKVRPLVMFEEVVVVNEESVPRFRFIENL